MVLKIKKKLIRSPYEICTFKSAAILEANISPIVTV